MSVPYRYSDLRFLTGCMKRCASESALTPPEPCTRFVTTYELSHYTGTSNGLHRIRRSSLRSSRGDARRNKLLLHNDATSPAGWSFMPATRHQLRNALRI